MIHDLIELVGRLRATGGDTAEVEVKSGAGGLPTSLLATLSAMANHPGGGLIILGLDEATGFRPVPLPDPQALKQGLAHKGRSAFTPPVNLTVTDGEIDGEPVIVTQVHECDPSMKPCRITASGAAYVRGYDGDFQISALEEQAFLAARQPPLFDRQPVPGANRDDLDRELIAEYLQSVRQRDPHGLGRFQDDAELLRRAGVTTTNGTPTVAGLLALGTYPQEWFPRYVIQASAEPLDTDPVGSRARNQMTITGPIPRMLDEALTWARRTFDSTIVSDPSGIVRDVPVYPYVAFREIISNALIHRDLDQWSIGMAVEVRLRRNRLIVSNPGGLYGITVDRLGRDAVTSARNARLVAICQHVRTPGSGARVIEALATGIPIVTSALAEASLPPAHYVDAAIRFTVVLQQPAQPVRPGEDLTATELMIYDALAGTARSVTDLTNTLGLSKPNIRKALRELRTRGLVEQIGGPGKPTSYRRRSE
ncbi:ATP-binding protein [Acrocarpospora macrocephala]|uniref:Dihydroorotate dehydrogenase n=1 Tax=Acrocarpospora macrocephala TaxID=150177 RepID=A0A5M3WS85_9ACTN|nr:ATP-binding protein [Acrocarpospora macrocephala]GES11022.1 dihydroorotate dehydrogenase [Acrocarpospora macrocephala]